MWKIAGDRENKIVPSLRIFMVYLDYIASYYVRVGLFHDLFSLINKPRFCVTQYKAF